MDFDNNLPVILCLLARYADLQLPKTKSHVEEKTGVLSETKIKFKEKKVDSLGDGLAAFKKRKQATRSLKARDADS